MIILLHVLIAISSILYTGFVFFSPSKKRLLINYVFVFLTIATGTYLVFLKSGHLIQACLMGLAYLGVVMVGIVSARYKLAQKAE